MTAKQRKIAMIALWTFMKMYLKLLIFFLVLTGFMQNFSADLPLLRSPMTILLEDQIQPRYISLAFEAAALRNMAVEFCQSPHNKHFGLLQQQWRITMLSWQSAVACSLPEAVRPINTTSQANDARFLGIPKKERQDEYGDYWPSQTSLVEINLSVTQQTPILKKQALGSEDKTFLQSLNATEHLLFDTNTKKSRALNKSEYCKLLLDNTDVLLISAIQLKVQWESLGRHQQQLMKVERNELGLGLEFWVLNSLATHTKRLQKELTQLQVRPGRQPVENIRAAVATFDALVALTIEQSLRVERADAWKPIVRGLENLSLSRLSVDLMTGVDLEENEALRQAQRQLVTLAETVAETAYQLGVRIGGD